ncbi:MAG: metal ABC transporter ATP-binding protein [Ruaniaceae bacterium]|nr:metal ABC transporter ATP-binding protein [Ruaniaceae bacterium]
MSEILARAAGLVLGYGDSIAVADGEFEVPVGSVTAIIGPNGSGKSTVLHALAGIVKPRAGSLEVLGAPPGRQIRRVSYVMQTVAIPRGVPITVRETVAMGRYASVGWFRRFGDKDQRRVKRAMERMRITDLADRHLWELSGGQRQRVYVAQGIAQEHELLLLDEPLTGLDIVTARTIDELIHSEHENGHSVILTTHDLDEARAADYVILMGGRVVAAGPPGSVLTDANLALAYGLGALHAHAPDTRSLDDHAPE